MWVETLTEESAELTLLVAQNQTYLTLQEGISQQISFEDADDAAKYLVLDVPEGDVTVNINVRSKTPLFYPKLLVALDREEVRFAPENGRFDGFEEWDKDLYVLKTTMSFKQLEPEAFLALTLLYHSDIPEYTANATAIITVSYS